MVLRSFARKYSLFEYHAKKLLRDNDIRVQKGSVARTINEAIALGNTLDPTYIVKANVQTGGRGKGQITSGLKGGVQFCDTIDQLTNCSDQMLGHKIITKQTGPQGLDINSLLIVQGVDIQKQYYLAYVLDRQMGGPAVIASKHGGTDIEETAQSDPDSILVRAIDIQQGMTDDLVDEVLDKIEMVDSYKEEARHQMHQMYKVFQEKDSLTLEINPWATCANNELYCVDAKIIIDENALFRQPLIQEYKKEAQTYQASDQNEQIAEKLGLSYVGLDGNVGCLVNGAGLAMSTMDVVKFQGGEPANFLDVGGGANKKQLRQAFEILFNHSNVKSVFVNIFAGILRCDLLAQALVDVKNDMGFAKPVVVRLQGTNVEEGQRIIEENRDDNLYINNDMEEAARVAIRLATS